MVFKELSRLIDYEIPCIEFYNEEGGLEYIANLRHYTFEDIDVIISDHYEPFGIVKLTRANEAPKKKASPNGTSL